MIAKKKLMLIIISCVSAVVILLGTLATIYFTTEIFKSPKQLFLKYFAQEGELLDFVNFSDMKTIANRLCEEKFNVAGEIKVTDNDNQESILNSLSVVTSGQLDGETSKHNIDTTIKYNDLNLSTFSIKTNQNRIGITNADIIDQAYIAIDNTELRDFFGKIGINDDIIINQVDIRTTIEAFVNSATEEQYYLEFLAKILNENLDKTKFTKVKVDSFQLNDVSYNTKAVNLQLSEMEAQNLLVQVLNSIKQDTFIMNSLVTKYKNLRNSEEYTSQDFSLLLDQIIENINANEPDMATIYTITLDYSNKELIRTKVVNNSTNKTYELYYKNTNAVKTLDFITTLPSGEKAPINITREIGANEVKYKYNISYFEAAETAEVNEAVIETNENTALSDETQDQERELTDNTTLSDGNVQSLDQIAETQTEQTTNNYEIKTISGSITKKGEVLSDTLTFIINHKFDEYDVNGNIEFTSKPDIKTLDLEDYRYLLLNEQKPEDIQLLGRLIINRIGEVIQEKTKLIEMVN